MLRRFELNRTYLDKNYTHEKLKETAQVIYRLQDITGESKADLIGRVIETGSSMLPKRGRKPREKIMETKEEIKHEPSTVTANITNALKKYGEKLEVKVDGTTWHLRTKKITWMRGASGEPYEKVSYPEDSGHISVPVEMIERCAQRLLGR